MQWEEEYDIYEMISYFREAMEQSCFMEALIIGCWSIRNHRNNAIFEDRAVNLSTCFNFFKESILLIRHMAKPSLKEGMTVWLDTL
jgi:hypothetical protein